MRFLVAYNSSSVPAEEVNDTVRASYDLDENAAFLFENVWLLDTEISPVAPRDRLAITLRTAGKPAVSISDSLAISGFTIHESVGILGL